jgi:predicted SprT family Zn-dependent metalloprotease
MALLRAVKVYLFMLEQQAGSAAQHGGRQWNDMVHGVVQSAREGCFEQKERKSYLSLCSFCQTKVETPSQNASTHTPVCSRSVAV